MKLVQTLSAIALVGAVAPSAFALSVKDDNLTIDFKFEVQARAYLLNDAENATGGAYDPLRGIDGQEAEAARFDMRRARFGLNAKYGDWKGVFRITADNADRVAANGSRGVNIYYANAARVFKVGDDYQHDIHFGLDKPFNGESSISSSQYMMPSQSIVANRIETRGVGLGYGFRSPFIDVGVDLQNNSTGTIDPQASEPDETETNGYFYSARIQFAPGKEYHPVRQESYCGKEGTGLIVGLDFQWNDGDLTTNGAAGTYAKTDTFTWGPDVLFHWNALSALAEYRMRKTEADVVTDATGATASTDADGEFWDIGAEWAFLIPDGMALAPSVRYGVRDSDTDTESTTPYGSGPDIGNDGTQIELGLSLYINGHNNKLQLSYQMWEAEDGDATADIIRLQHQWYF